MKLSSIYKSHEYLESMLSKIDSLMIAVPFDCMLVVEGDGSDFPKHFDRIVKFIGTNGTVSVIDDCGTIWEAENYLTLVRDLIRSYGLYQQDVTEDSGYQKARELARQEFKKARENKAEVWVCRSSHRRPDRWPR